MRVVAMMVGGIFLVRYWWHIKHWWQHEREYLPIKIRHRRTHRLSFFQIHASKFVLQVLGGAGAIWGCSEAATLRNSTNVMQWRIVAVSVGIMFLIRWSFEIAAYCLYFAALWTNPSSMHMKLLRWYEAITVKLILEVFGAVGACWGFSEIATWRNPDTTYVWRPISLAMGALFFVGWIMQLVKFIQSERDSTASKNQVRVDETHSEEVEQLDVADLELEETTSLDALNEAASVEYGAASMEFHNETLEERSASPTPTNPSTPQKRQKKQMINDVIT
jgi:hypothetical protein